jgi:hypothetical protein
MRTCLQMTTAGFIAVAISCPVIFDCAARADGLQYEFGEPYLQRIEGVTKSAGNAKDVNAVTHMIDPWPRNIKDRRIRGNGERMVGAVARYRLNRPAPPAIVPIYNTTGLQSTAQTSSGATRDSAGPATTPAR